MSETTHLLPQADRLVRRIESLDAPLVAVWGWPGSGSSAVLQALLARPGVAGLSLGDLATESALHSALASTAEAHWLVVPGDPGERLGDLMHWMRPRQQLVFACNRRRPATSLPVALIPPQELLLTVGEVTRLWHLLSGRQPISSASLALWRASDGWYRPVRLAVEATGGVGLDGVTAEQLLEIPQVRLFLRHEVIDSLPSDERRRLLAAPAERPAAGHEPAGEPSGAAAAGAALADAWRVAEELGLWVEGGDRDRLPALLAAALDRERRRQRPRSLAPAAGLAPGGVAGGVGAVGSGGGVGGAGGAGGAGARGLAEPPARSSYRVLLFGGVVVHQLDDGGQREVSWKLRRSLQVLAFLASSPGLEAGREDLEEAVWPADGERTIHRNFHPTLSHLRRALDHERRGSMPPPLLFRGAIYRLNPEIEWNIDLQEFDRRIAEGRELLTRGDERAAADTWHRAWKLYRGPFMQGYYEAWATARREAYQQAHVELLRELGDLSVRLERAEDALDAYRSVLLADALQERTHLAVMRLYSSQGRRDLVRRQYERLCTLLLDELGVEPLPETVQEYHRLMS